MSAKPVVLVIEGSSSEGETLTRLLHSRHYHTIVIDNPTDALAYLESPVDLVLSGISPSHSSGRDLLQTWRARRPDTPFAILTRADGISAAEAAVDSGAVGYLVHPFHGEQTMTQIMQWLERSQEQNGQSVDEEQSHRQQPALGETDRSAIKIPPGTTLETLERAAVEQALVQHQGNRTHAAKELGISVRTLQRKLKAWGGGNPGKAASSLETRVPGSQTWDTRQSSARTGNYHPGLLKT
jgi:DNA-binding NtrC family response regulator